MKEVHHQALQVMRERGGDWFAYVNSDLGHSQCGHMQFLQCGADCTFKSPPQTLPDMPGAINWRYQYEGKVDLETGTIIKYDPKTDGE